MYSVQRAWVRKHRKKSCLHSVSTADQTCHDGSISLFLLTTHDYILWNSRPLIVPMCSEFRLPTLSWKKTTAYVFLISDLFFCFMIRLELQSRKTDSSANRAYLATWALANNVIHSAVEVPIGPVSLLRRCLFSLSILFMQQWHKN